MEVSRGGLGAVSRRLGQVVVFIFKDRNQSLEHDARCSPQRSLDNQLQQGKL